jgi:hypothetical protein
VISAAATSRFVPVRPTGSGAEPECAPEWGMASHVPRWIAVGALIALVAVDGACQSTALEPLPLDLRVDLDRASVNPGDTVHVVTTAEGGTLLGIVVDYGDGTSDSYGTGGARTAKVTFKHAYSASGAYTVKAVVTVGAAGDKTATAQLHVN